MLGGAKHQKDDAVRMHDAVRIWKAEWARAGGGEGRGELRQAHPDAGVCGVLDGFLKLVELRARTKQKTKSFRAALLLPGA